MLSFYYTNFKTLIEQIFIFIHKIIYSIIYFYKLLIQCPCRLFRRY